jgi:hypothetical protein
MGRLPHESLSASAEAASTTDTEGRSTTMQTQGLTSHVGRSNPSTTGAFADPARRVAISALLVGAAVGAWSGWGLERVVAMTTSGTSGEAAAPVAPAVTSGARPTSTGRSLAVEFPADDAYLTTASIPVAGLAYGRPHGPKVSSVHVELIAGGEPLTSADIPVYSGRFAGVLQMPVRDGRVTAELRISDPLHTGDNAVVRTVTIDQR